MADEHAPYQFNAKHLASWQKTVTDSPGRYLIVQGDPACGKTYAVLCAIAKRAMAHPGSTCAYYGHTLHLYEARDMLMQILAQQMGTDEFQGTVRYDPLVVCLPNGSEVCLMSPESLKQQGAGFELRYAAVDLNAPRGVDALSARSQDGIAMTLSQHWQIVGPALETVPPSSRNFFRRMIEGDWSGVEEKGSP